MDKPFKLHKSEDRQFYLTLHGKNGEILSTSETLKSKQAAKKNVLAQVGALNIDPEKTYDEMVEDLTKKKKV